MRCKYCGDEITETREGVFIKEWSADGTEHQCSQFHITLTMPNVKPFGVDIRITDADMDLSMHEFRRLYFEPAFEQLRSEYEARK